MKDRKILHTSEETGYSAFFDRNHNGVTVGIIKEDGRVMDPSYLDTPEQAFEKLARIEAKYGFEEGVAGSYASHLRQSLDLFRAEMKDALGLK